MVKIVGVINLTENSFSGDGLIKSGTNLKDKLFRERLIHKAEKLVKDGADIIDIGAISTKPQIYENQIFVDASEEFDRIQLACEIVKNAVSVPLSVDTLNYNVAKIAVAKGALIINCVTLEPDKRIVKLVANSDKLQLVITHDRGLKKSKDVVAELVQDLKQAIKNIVTAFPNIELIIDVGIGYGKGTTENMTILRNLSSIKSEIQGYPLFISTSRKRFLGEITGENDANKLISTISSIIYAVQNGVDLVRVHDVKETKYALKFISKLS